MLSTFTLVQYDLQSTKAWFYFIFYFRDQTTVYQPRQFYLTVYAWNLATSTGIMHMKYNQTVDFHFRWVLCLWKIGAAGFLPYNSLPLLKGNLRAWLHLLQLLNSHSPLEGFLLLVYMLLHANETQMRTYSTFHFTF